MHLSAILGHGILERGGREREEDGDRMISTSRVLLMKQIVFCFCFSRIANGILESVEFCLDFSSLHEILLTLKDGIVTYAYILETEGSFT
ncbi:hypothetical protein CEXT_98821 [Caerostris extrusa]|uniref:Uncharacterized protein n=1 Tax=Caerostris extrusa TaxID=172846 RepID=A0AAV4XV34_CAEEX|nr:hypothetical protein CEXT_98821 [Caerostris extrusa]